MKSALFILLLATIFAVVHYGTATPAFSTKLQSQETQLEAADGDQQAKVALFNFLREGWKAVKKFLIGKSGGGHGGEGEDGGGILPERKLEEKAVQLQQIFGKEICDKLRSLIRADRGRGGGARGSSAGGFGGIGGGPLGGGGGPGFGGAIHTGRKLEKDAIELQSKDIDKESIQTLLELERAALVQDHDPAKMESWLKVKNAFKRIVAGVNYALNGPGSGTDNMGGGGESY